MIILGKYFLVASYYNQKTKVYEKETIIKLLDGISFESLYDIDLMTSKYNLIDLLKMIESENKGDGFNHLAIKYLKNKNELPIYYRIIENDLEFNKCIISSSKLTKCILGKKRTTNYISRHNKLYKQELEKLLKIIETKNYELFLSIYNKEKDKDKDFVYLVKRYMNSSYDTYEAESNDLMEILVEFSRYKTFRGWYVNNLKLKNNIKSKSIVKPVKKSKNRKNKVSSISENIAKFEERFEQVNGISYDSYQKNQYNKENDEYLSEEEYLSMFDLFDDDTSYKRH